jgi:outer membrane protein TolC
MKRLSIFFLVLSFLPTTYAAKVPQLSLQEAIFLALRYNVSIKNAELDRVVQKYNLALAYHGFVPHLNTLTGSTNYNETKTNGIKSYGESYGLTPSASVKTALGTDITANMDNSYDGTRYSQGVTLNITQPLLRGFGPDIAQIPLLNAIDQEKINRIALKGTVTETIKSVITKYYDVLKDYNSLKLSKLSLQNSVDRLKEAEVKEKIGRLSGLDLLQTRTNIPRDQLSVSAAESQLVQDKNNFLNTIGLQSDFVFTIPQTIKVDIIKAPSFAECVNTALNNNIAYQRKLLEIKRTERSLREVEDKARWKLDLTAKVTSGASSNPNAMAFDGENNNKSVGLSLEIPLDRLQIKHDIADSKIALHKARIDLAQAKREIELNIANRLDRLKSAEQQIQLAITSRDYYAKLLAVEQKKLELGRASVFQLNSFQRDYVNYEQQVINNQIAYLNALVDLQDYLGTLLNEWRIAIRY